MTVCLLGPSVTCTPVFKGRKATRYRLFSSFNTCGKQRFGSAGPAASHPASSSHCAYQSSLNSRHGSGAWFRSRDLQDLFPARRTAAHDTLLCTLAGYSSMGREGATRSRSPGHERARACMQASSTGQDQASSTGQDRPDVGIEPTTRCLFHRRGKGHSTATRSSGSEISSFTRRRRYAPIRRPPSGFALTCCCR